MPNKTIYVSEKDALLFDEAKEIAGEALSSVIARALREYVARHGEKAKAMQEISVKIGSHFAEREQRFTGIRLGTWQGFSDDKEWWLNATIYQTQKGNIAVHLITVCKASLFTNKKEWKEKGDYLIDARTAVLIVGQTPEEFKTKLPKDLYHTLLEYTQKNESPVEYLDI
jgi:EXLDI family protein